MHNLIDHLILEVVEHFSLVFVYVDDNNGKLICWAMKFKN